MTDNGRPVCVVDATGKLIFVSLETYNKVRATAEFARLQAEDIARADAARKREEERRQAAVQAAEAEAEARRTKERLAAEDAAKAEAAERTDTLRAEPRAEESPDAKALIGAIPNEKAYWMGWCSMAGTAAISKGAKQEEIVGPGFLASLQFSKSDGRLKSSQEFLKKCMSSLPYEGQPDSHGVERAQSLVACLDREIPDPTLLSFTKGSFIGFSELNMAPFPVSQSGIVIDIRMKCGGLEK